MTLSEQNNCGKIGFRCGAKAQQVEHEHDDEHESPTSEIGLKAYKPGPDPLRKIRGIARFLSAFID